MGENKKIENIFFIHRFHFNKEYYNRDDFEYLKNAGYNVRYLDLVNFLKSKDIEDTCPEDLKENVIYFNHKKDFYDFLRKHSHNSVIITDVGLQVNSAWFYSLIFKSKISYYLIDLGLFPKLQSNNIIKDSHQKVKRIFSNCTPIYLFFKLFRLLKYYCVKRYINPATAIFDCKDKTRKRLKMLSDDHTILIPCNSADWDNAKKCKKNRIIKDKYVVFLDQYIPHHPDLFLRNLKIPFTADEYYENLNKFFNKIEEITNYKVVIAAHPRRMSQYNDDFNFPLFFGKTAELVYNSEFVLAHYSTAINYPVIFNKPCLLLDSQMFNKTIIDVTVKQMAKTIKINRYYFEEYSKITSDYIQQNVENSNNSYDDFINRNLKHRESNGKTLGEQIDIFINKL